MPEFRKSSYSDNGDCVELAPAGDAVLLRDSKDPDGPVLAFTRAEMAGWIAGCKAGEFDSLA